MQFLEMREITWLDLMEDCWVGPGFRSDAIAEVDSTKVMVRMAYRAGCSLQDVWMQAQLWLLKRKCSAQRLLEIEKEFAIAWLWATPLRRDHADDNLERARQCLREAKQILQHSKDLGAERDWLMELIRQGQTEIKAAREIYGVQQQLADAELEVDPASGREVYVVKDTPDSV